MIENKLLDLVRERYPIGSALLIGSQLDYDEEKIEGYLVKKDKLLLVFESGSSIDIRRIGSLLVNNGCCEHCEDQ